MMQAKQMAEVYEKYQKGDPISDEELRLTIPCLENNVEFLDLLGERFHFAWRELFSFLEGLKNFREARMK
jgi:hypothetical protein